MSVKPKGTKSLKKAKTAAKKQRSSKKPAAKAKPARAQLLKQVAALASTLDESSLRSLIQDAAILAHNEQVLKDYNAGRELRAQPRKPPVRAGIEEGKDGTFFIIILNGYRNIFGIDEMRKLVKTCHVARNPAEGAARLFAWIERERRDIIHNSKIYESGDPSLADLWEKIVGAYAVKE